MPKTDKPKAESELVQFKLRMREGLRASIEKAANASGGSMNTEIVRRLEDSFFTEQFLGEGDLRAALQVIASDAWRIERLTGKKWKEDRASSLALAQFASDTFKFTGAPQPAMDELTQALNDWDKWKERCEMKMTFLKEVGAIRKIEAPRGLLGYTRRSVPEEWGPCDALLRVYQFEPAVDLSVPPEEWRLDRDGSPLSDAELISISARFKSLNALASEWDALWIRLDKANREEKEAAAEAEKIVAALTSPQRENDLPIDGWRHGPPV